MKKIAFVHEAFPSGGAERITCDICSYLSENQPGKYEFYVMCNEFCPEKLNARFRDVFSVIALPEPVIHKSERDTECIIGEIKKHGIDIIVQPIKEVYDVHKVKARTGCKVIFSNHGAFFWEERYFLNARAAMYEGSAFRRLKWKLLKRWIYILSGKAGKAVKALYAKNYYDSDAYTVLCDEYRRQMIEALGLDASDNHVFSIPNPEYEVPDPSLDKKKVLIYSGRISYADKSVDKLVKIWKSVYKKMPGWVFKIIGDGPDLESLKQYAADNHVERMQFEGYQRDMSQYYREASILCLTSAAEGWGLCLTEAQANGVIPVSFNISAAVREIIWGKEKKNGQYGFLIKKFSLSEYARTLVSISKMPERKIISLRKRILEKSREYSPDNVCRKWGELFDMLTA